MTLFMAFWGDHTNNQSYFARLKCYYFRIYGADGTPKRDLVPARRLSDGAIGLLDRVENVFHENQGSGVFTAGETVTSGTTGELHVDVPPGVTATAGQGNAFTGGLKLVKEGAGTFVPGGTLGHQGGTQVDGGMLRVAEGMSGIGAKGGEILVGPGATVEMNGAIDFVDNCIHLAGGTLQNTGADVDDSQAQMANVRLSADSTLNIVNSFGFVGSASGATTLDLGGHDLTVNVASGKTFWFENVDVTAGTLAVAGAGTFAIDKTSLRGAEADFALSCANVTVAVNGDVGDWTVGANTAVSGNGTLTIHGTYRPSGDSTAQYVFASGATLDLSDLTAAFDITGKNVSFAAGASIAVDVGERTLNANDKLVSWAAAPSGVVFALAQGSTATGGLLTRNDGLFYTSGPAYATIAPATGEWSFFTADGDSYSGWEQGVTSEIEVRFSSKAEYDAIRTAGVTPSRYVLTGLELAEDLDLSQGFDFALATGATIDLKGHKLHLPAKMLEDSARVTVTDTGTAGYDILTYIQATGAQWIDTGLAATNDDRIEMKVNFSDISAIHTLWCARASNGMQAFSAFYLAGTNPPLRFDHPNTKQIGPSIAANTDYSIIADGKTCAVTVNGTTYSQKMADGGAYTSPDSISLFMAYTGTQETSQGYFARVKCYSFRIYGADGTLKRDFVPARRMGDGAVGLLDRVENVFHENKGTGADFTAGAVVRSIGSTGELYVNVPAGVTAAVGPNAITGRLKLVKDGEGTLVADETLTHRGGTRIDCGVVRLAEDALLVGASGSEIAIGQSATLDVNGTPVLNANVVTLAGGTLRNTGADIDEVAALPVNVRLSADSTMKVDSSFGFVGNGSGTTVFDLGEHRLTVDIAAGKRFLLGNADVSNGTLTVTGAGTFAIDKTSLRGHEASFNLACANVTAAVNCDVGGWAVGANTTVSGNGKVTIYGTYSPIGDSVSQYALVDGAIMDLSGRTAAFDITGKNIAFMVGATLKVGVGERMLASGEKLISWAAAPTGVSFAFADVSSPTANLQATGDGLYYSTGPAYATIDPATGEWAFFTMDGDAYSGWEQGVTSDIEVRFSSKPEYDAIRASGVTPSRYVLTGLELAEDLDLSQGFDFALATGATIDLKGHRLRLPAKMLEDSARGTVTDTGTAGYDILTYIQATGAQWIDTGLAATNDDRIEMKVNFSDISAIHALWCARASNGMQAFSLFYLTGSNPPLRFDHPYGVTIGPSIAANADYSIVADGKTCAVTINGTTYSQKMRNDAGAYTSPDSISLFMSYSGTQTNAQNYFARLKCYYFRIYGADGTLKRDFVPARRMGDGAVGLLDRVENVFHENQGSGVFTAGETVRSLGSTGELHVNVPAGETATIGANTITGRLKLVKDGAGTLIPSGTLTYMSDSRIDDGTLQLSYVRLGVSGSEITVGPGGTLDMKGSPNLIGVPVNLAGGTLRNSGGDISADFAMMNAVRLLDDSTMKIDHSFGFVGSGYTATTLDLGGHELTVDIDSGRSFWFDNVGVTAGKLTVSGAGTFAIGATSMRGAEADFDLGCARVTAAVNCDVGGWTVGANTSVSGSGTVTIHGAYRPNGDSVTKYVLAHGATFDLSGRSTVFDIRGKNVSFANGATICVKPQLGLGGLVVPWTEPANFSGLTFVKVPSEKGWLIVDTDGISVRRGLAIFIR